MDAAGTITCEERTQSGSITDAVILAAGLSTRLGRQKALIEVNGQLLIDWMKDNLLSAGISRVVVVIHPGLIPYCEGLTNCTFIINESPMIGRMRSIQLGLAAIPKESREHGVLIAPIDRCGWSLDAIHMLRSSRAPSAPMTEGRKGHPITLDKETIQRIVDCEPDTSLRSIVTPKGRATTCRHLHLNLDTEEDVTRFLTLDPEDILGRTGSQIEGGM
ncbi:MAG: hypothetical protein CMB77_00500 [Euryarchaeota archaeon]|nr:hypothetical protein [Euryarchaeota archaeon]